MTHQPKCLWAVDPFADKRTQLTVAKHLKEFLKGDSTQVEPTAVINPGQILIPQADGQEGREKFKLAAQSKLEKITQGLKLPMTDSSIVFSDSYSQRKSVETLIHYAKEKHANFIALGTHAREGFNRWLLGSFAETLLLQSPVPLLIVNPRSHKPEKIKTVLYATDLSEASEKGVEKIIPVLKGLKAKLILFHKMDYVLPETYSLIYRSDVYEQYLKDDEKQRHVKLETLEKKLNAQGIKVEIIVDDRPGFVPEAIVKAAKKHKAQVIALVSQTGTAGATFLGSITRQVVRTASCPIWTWHVPKT